MSTRRQFMRSLPAFAVAGHMLPGEWHRPRRRTSPDERAFPSQGQSALEVHAGGAQTGEAKLPFADKNFEEQKKAVLRQVHRTSIL